MIDKPTRRHVVARSAALARRQILAVATEPAALNAALAAPDRSDVLVVAPALNTRLRHWVSDVDGARAAAAARLDTCLDALD